MVEKDALKKMSINEIIKKYPNTISLFNRFNIDSCCGGSEILEVAVHNARADLNAVIDAILKAISGEEV